MKHNKPSRAYLTQLRQRYAKASKRVRTQILNEFVQTAHYQRKYAIALLRSQRVWRAESQPIQRKRRRRYLSEDKPAVLWLAELFDQIGSKRLRAAMNTELDPLYRQKQLQVSCAWYARLQVISPATLDRLRQSGRKSAARTRGGTKPGSLLKSQIPIRTFAQWDDKRPGFTEIDLIQHEGGNASRFLACTLTLTAVCTGWTELRAVITKAQGHVFSVLKDSRSVLPFALRGIDSDHGAEFINDQLLRYGSDEQLTFRRGCVGRKNDNP